MSKLKDTKVFKAAVSVVKRLQNNGHTAYFVGGIVRDMLLDKESKDIDIVTSALPDVVDSLFKRTHHIGAAFGIINVVEQDINFEVATFREEREYMDGRHPEEVIYTTDPRLDAIRRDFTINGMFYDPITEEIFDFVNGKEDLKKGIIRTIDDPEIRFREDFLRMLRAVRFANRFDFKLDENTANAIKELNSKVTKLSAERVRDELTKMITGPHPDQSIIMLDNLGILQHILPEVCALKGVEQPKKYHPEGDVFIHTMLMLKEMSSPALELAWSILLHDIGKPATYSVDDKGIEHFYRHESKGAVIAETIMKRLRFSKKETKAVVECTQNHMRMFSADKMRPAKWKRILAHEHFSLELELHRIDLISSNGDMETYHLMAERMKEFENNGELPPPLLTGQDLIKQGIKPGPNFSKILNELQDHQLDGSITTKDAAIEFVKRYET